eukprot:Colp12_sorted_trinity150504_noHs@16740
MASKLAKITNNLFVMDSVMTTMKFISFPIRMTIFKLEDGSLILHSPFHPDVYANELKDLGEVKHIIAPNKHHNLWAAASKLRYPEAKLWSCPEMSQRLNSNGGVKVEGELKDDTVVPWSDEIARVHIKGWPFFEEVVFLHKASRTLVVTDLCFNLRRDYEGLSTAARLYFSAVGAMRPVNTSYPFARFAVKDRAAMKQSLDAIMAWDFDRIVMTHGDIVHTDGKQLLRSGAYASFTGQ